MSHEKGLLLPVCEKQTELISITAHNYSGYHCCTLSHNNIILTDVEIRDKVNNTPVNIAARLGHDG